MSRAAVLGTGLIGASVGIGLRAAGWTVAGWDPDSAALDRARSMGAVSVAADSLEDAVAGSDLVVLAGPVEAIVETIPRLTGTAPGAGPLVTDVAGVKMPVVFAAEGHPRFVAGHPMAGRETSGPDGASGSMFYGATWVLCTDGASPEDLERMHQIVESLGAHAVLMSAAEHDRAVAAASHLPQIAAAALVELVGEDAAALGLAAGGFRDLTRVAMSDPSWWVDVLVGNRREVVTALRRFAERLEGLATEVEGGLKPEIADRMSNARAIRRSMAAPVETVSILLEDRPGQMARVGHSLSESGVDLRDLQLRHAVHGGGGVLTLSVRSGEASKLRAALSGDGFTILSP